MADGDATPITPSVQAAADQGVDFYGSWQDSWRAVERDAQWAGTPSSSLARFLTMPRKIGLPVRPDKRQLTHHALLNRDNGVRTHVYRASGRRHVLTWPAA